MACRALPVVTRPSGPSTIAVNPIGFAHPGWPHKKSNWVQYTSETLGRHSGCNKLNVPSDLLTLTKACLQNRTYPPESSRSTYWAMQPTPHKQPAPKPQRGRGPACIRSPLPANKRERTTGSSSSRSSNNNNSGNNCTPAPWCTPPQ